MLPLNYNDVLGCTLFCTTAEVSFSKIDTLSISISGDFSFLLLRQSSQVMVFLTVLNGQWCSAWNEILHGRIHIEIDIQEQISNGVYSLLSKLSAAAKLAPSGLSEGPLSLDFVGLNAAIPRVN